MTPTTPSPFGLICLVATSGAFVLASACAGVVQEPSDPLKDPPESHAFIPPPDADADVPNPKRDPARYEPLASLDSSGDGVIDEAELGIASEKAFAAFDANHDEQLDRDELRAGAEVTGAAPDDVAAATAAMERWDEDGDGVLERGEFATGRMRMLDADRDARVDEREWNSQSWQHRYGLPLDGEEHPGY